MRSPQPEPSDDQLALFSLDDEQEEQERSWSAEAAADAEPKATRPSGIAQARLRREEAADSRRAADPEGTAAEDARVEAEAREALRLFKESRVLAQWASQDKIARGIVGSTSRMNLDFGVSAKLAEQSSLISKGFLADYPSQSLRSAMGESLRISEQITKQTNQITRGILSAYPSASIAATLRSAAKPTFSPALAAQMSQVAAAANKQLSEQMVSAYTPAVSSIISALGVYSAGTSESIRTLLSGISGAAALQRQSALEGVRIAAQAAEVGAYTSRLIAGAMPLVQEQERLSRLISQTIAGVSQSLRDELTTLADEAEQHTTKTPPLGTTNLVTPSVDDLPLLDEEARRLGFPPIAKDALSKTASAIAATGKGTVRVFLTVDAIYEKALLLAKHPRTARWVWFPLGLLSLAMLTDDPAQRAALISSAADVLDLLTALAHKG